MEKQQGFGINNLKRLEGFVFEKRLVTMKKKVYVKNMCRKESDSLSFMQPFVESCIKLGIHKISEGAFFQRIKLTGILTHIARCLNIFAFQYFFANKKAVIVCTSGSHLIYKSLPYSLIYETIPMFWDCWPVNWEEQLLSLRKLNVKICFVTSSQVAEKIQLALPSVKAYWIPEGVCVSNYFKGECLEKRNIEIYELGRQKTEYHQILSELKNDGLITTFYHNQYCGSGNIRLKSLAFPTEEALTKALRDIKIVVSFPKIDTHSIVETGEIETLTQRYWESMLSRNLIIGRAPNELIKLIGYNPVIDVDWNNPKEQIANILLNISDYQVLVDRNYLTAIDIASWDNRVERIKKILRKNGYEL